MKPATLHLKKEWGTTPPLTLFLLILLTVIAESVARSKTFQMPLTPPKMGSRHYQLGHKLALLDAMMQQNSDVDCIMLGSSMVDTGFNPTAFETEYKNITGREIHCFNFGIDASTAGSTAALARILVEDYHPRILIVGTDARDYAVPSDDRDPAVVLNTPWVAYRQGDFSLEGWLQNNSYLYRYRQHLSRLARFQNENTVWSETKLNYEILSNGFTPLDTTATYINDPPKTDDDSFEVTYYKRIYSPYQILQENLDAVERIMAYEKSGISVILVEMPVADGLYFFFGNGKSDYDRFTARVDYLAKLHKVTFWQTEPLDFISDNGWVDYSHLNRVGANEFSTWLGQAVGRADREGSITTLLP